MANCKDMFVYVSSIRGIWHDIVLEESCYRSFLLQQLGTNLGHDVAKASTESMGVREISERIEKDVPQVSSVSFPVFHTPCFGSRMEPNDYFL